jgi:GxxExxY protein
VEINEITKEIIGAAIEVHKALGPGLLESVYEVCLVYELGKRGLRVEAQKSIPVVYGEIQIEVAYRVDLVVEECVLVEIKAVQKLEHIHEAQLLTYLRMTGAPVGLLINFNVPVLRAGIQRVVNGFREHMVARPEGQAPPAPRTATAEAQRTQRLAEEKLAGGERAGWAWFRAER